MKTFTIIMLVFMITVDYLNAQELPLVLEKQGTFEILSRTDYVSTDYGFTKAEISANLQKITELVNIVRKNPMLAENKGFDGRARLYNTCCKEPLSYGIPARISFEFAAWYKMKNGTEARGLIEPPEWSIYTNKLIPGWSNGFDTKYGYFTAALKKETPAPGIDVYDGECFVLYDASRPDYWLPVTVNEAFAAVRELYQNSDDKIGAAELLKWVEKEYNEIPVTDRDKPAYFGGNVSRVSSTPGYGGQENIFPRIMKVNPAYWDKTLPKSSIQFIYFRAVMNKPYLKSLKEESLKSNSISYHLYRFEESFDINTVKSLLPLVE